MTVPSTPVQPVERQDIHKSCRTIETLLTTLNDYCETAAAFAAVQKKLSKALKDAAGLKTNAQFAANAFSTSSLVLEALADIHSKCAKIVDKESTSVGSDVKKWFKKLAKEEKAHDERMNASNTRIKQAGQAYEKKSKKGAKDAGDEHARYIHLLSVIGPEMSQEKFNHAVHVTHQHTLVTFNVAATLSRVADAEWTRTCECMRRISPTIGSLGEWRSLCEGAWTGPLPDDLPEVSSETLSTQAPPNQAVSEWGQTDPSTPLRRSLPVPPVSGHSPGSVSAPAASSIDPPRSPFSTAGQNQGSINSITTLSAFPFPPTHFPVPLAMNEAELHRQQIQLRGLQPTHSRAGSPNLTPSQAVLAPPAPIITDSPKQMVAADVSEPRVLEFSRPSHPSQTPSVSQWSPTDAPPSTEPLTTPPVAKEVLKPVAGDSKNPRRPSLIARVPPPLDKFVRPTSPFKRAEKSSTEKEFGLHADGTQNAFKSHSVDTAKKHVERADSTRSTGSNVAALRNRYTRTAETSSQAPKDVPRLPMSVVEIASRYVPLEEPMSPRRAVSPIVDWVSPDNPSRAPTRDLPADENEIQRRKQELAELVNKEREYDLRQRERELNQRTRDFERDRLQFLSSRSPDMASTSATDGPRGPRNSPFQHKRGSRSVTHLNLPSTTSSLGSSAPSSSSMTLTRPSTSHAPTNATAVRLPILPQKDHAPFCGCDTCSVAKYKTTDASPSPRDLRPPEPPILLRTERPKGWIRRLSMPSVNVAFSLDAKKNASAVSLKAGFPLPGESGRLRKQSFEQGIGHRSLTGLGR